MTNSLSSLIIIVFYYLLYDLDRVLGDRLRPGLRRVQGVAGDAAQPPSGLVLVRPLAVEGDGPLGDCVGLNIMNL